MDFDEAIVAHTQWRGRLQSYLQKRDGSLNANDVALDDKCGLGHWIHGEGSKYTSLPEFATLRSEHAHFHKLAADLIRRADHGEKLDQEIAFNAKSEFNTVTSKVINSIATLRRKTTS